MSQRSTKNTQRSITVSPAADSRRHGQFAYVVRRPSFPEKLVSGLYKVVDRIQLQTSNAPDAHSKIHVGTRVETEPVRGLFGIRAKD